MTKLKNVVTGLIMTGLLAAPALANAKSVVIHKNVEVCEPRESSLKKTSKRKSQPAAPTCNITPMSITFNVSAKYANRNLTKSLLSSLSAEAIKNTASTTGKNAREAAIQRQLAYRILNVNISMPEPLFLNTYTNVTVQS